MLRLQLYTMQNVHPGHKISKKNGSLWPNKACGEVHYNVSTEAYGHSTRKNTSPQTVHLDA